MSHELIELEEEGWRALSAGDGAAARFYGQVLDDNPVMVLPGGAVLDDRELIIRSMSGKPWSSYRLDEGIVARMVTAESGIVVYGVTAIRAGSPPYSALMSSVYVRRPAGWKLVLHQQTPR